MATHRWIPVTEQLPPFVPGEKITDIVDIKYEDGSIGEGMLNIDKNWLIIDGESPSKKTITHWKPEGWIVNE